MIGSPWQSHGDTVCDVPGVINVTAMDEAYTDDDADVETLDDDDDNTDDDNDHKNDNYIAAGAAPGAGVPFSLFSYHRNHTSLNKKVKKTSIIKIPY